MHFCGVFPCVISKKRRFLKLAAQGTKCCGAGDAVGNKAVTALVLPDSALGSASENAVKAVCVVAVADQKALQRFCVVAASAV